MNKNLLKGKSGYFEHLFGNAVAETVKLPPFDANVLSPNHFPSMPFTQAKVEPKDKVLITNPITGNETIFTTNDVINVKQVIINNPAVIVITAEGNKFVSKAVHGDKFNAVKGFLLSFSKGCTSYNKPIVSRMTKTQFHKLIDKIRMVGNER